MSSSDRWAEISPGVLNQNQIEQLFKSGAITCNQFERPDIDASAFDLRIGKTVWSLTAGERPATRELARLKATSTSSGPQQDQDGEHFLFTAKQLYLVELDNHLDLPRNINGRATGKSSIGRLDVITRLLTENSREYDVVEAGYSGPLYMLVLPQTFPIKTRVGSSLNQLRLFSGAPYKAVVTRDSIADFGTPFWYVARKDRTDEYEAWELLLKNLGESLTADPSLFDLTVDLADPKLTYIYKALANNKDAIDLRKGAQSHSAAQYFSKTSIEQTGAAASVLLDRDSFYIMKSKERLFLPPDVAVEVVAISERIGDIRIHYAGFAHPGFGRHQGAGKRGTPLIFEVRPTDMQTRLYDGTLLAKIQLFRMSASTEPAKSAYDEQELKLSSVFSDPPEVP
jgi:dCTP deaminase